MLPSSATLLYTYSPLPHLTSSSIRLLPQSPLSAALVQVIYNLFIHKFRITFYFLSHLTSQQPYDTTVHAFPEKLSSLDYHTLSQLSSLHSLCLFGLLSSYSILAHITNVVHRNLLQALFLFTLQIFSLGNLKYCQSPNFEHPSQFFF